ncbi:YeeE/YedE thiosulfate transporter family protein [Breoghania sp.]|uniref:YeeE/YedE thiosulfate transporter family protein n=1 Tax=Breoghania sp. TaxID=2065378 RepID=UPI00262EAE43|nr:YeeE/YedE thiosulfate transporter family protein [Breoghania sp.]MDJ0932058.1 YeeE/YedE thiosulfate transporter family protein [Breoghania sp.]
MEGKADNRTFTFFGNKVGWAAAVLAVGIALGLALLVTFLIFGHGLGASGFVTRFAAKVSDWAVPQATAANAYFGSFVQAGSPLVAWITWESIGVLIGAYLGARSAGRISVQTERGPQVTRTQRFVYAFIGGALTGFGARLHLGAQPVRWGDAGGGRVRVSGRVLHRRFRRLHGHAEGLAMSIPFYDSGVASGLLSGILFGFAL